MITDAFLAGLLARKIKKISDIRDIQIFKSGKFSFKIMKEADFAFFNEVRNDITQLLHTNSQPSPEECKSWFQNNQDSLYFIVFFDKKQLGYFRTNSFNFKDRNLYVAADFHKDFRWVGHEVPAYRAFFRIMNEIGFSHFYLETLSRDERDIKLYKKLGFRKIEEVDYEIINGERIFNILMEKNYAE